MQSFKIATLTASNHDGHICRSISPFKSFTDVSAEYKDPDSQRITQLDYEVAYNITSDKDCIYEGINDQKICHAYRLFASVLPLTYSVQKQTELEVSVIIPQIKDLNAVQIKLGTLHLFFEDFEQITRLDWTISYDPTGPASDQVSQVVAVDDYTTSNDTEDEKEK